jgi:hypothetical protein
MLTGEGELTPMDHREGANPACSPSALDGAVMRKSHFCSNLTSASSLRLLSLLLICFPKESKDRKRRSSLPVSKVMISHTVRGASGRSAARQHKETECWIWVSVEVRTACNSNVLGPVAF